MIKYLLLAIIFIGCNSRDEQTEEAKAILQHTIDSVNYSIILDSSFIKLKEAESKLILSFEILDAQLRCLNKQMEYGNKYLETGNYKYFRLSKKYYDSVHYYYKKGQELK